MPTRCPVCAHVAREAIEAHLLTGSLSYREMMESYPGTHLRALSWHKHRCMTPEPAGDELRSVINRVFTGETRAPDWVYDLPDPLEPDLEDFPDFDFLELPEPDLEPFDFPELEPVDFGELFEAAEGKGKHGVSAGRFRAPESDEPAPGRDELLEVVRRSSSKRGQA